MNGKRDPSKKFIPVLLRSIKILNKVHQNDSYNFLKKSD